MNERPVGRRVVLGLVGLTVGTVVLGGRLPAALRRAIETPLEDLGPGDGFHFYSVAAGVPRFEAAGWRLRLDGLVATPVDLSLADLRATTPTEVVADFHCVSGWSVRAGRWRGVRVSALLDRAASWRGSGRCASSRPTAPTQTACRLEVALRRDVLIALDLNGRPLGPERGAPARLVVPGLYGYKGVKWVRRITAVQALEPGYWEVRGYDTDARVRD